MMTAVAAVAAAAAAKVEKQQPKRVQFIRLRESKVHANSELIFKANTLVLLPLLLLPCEPTEAAAAMMDSGH